MLTFRAMAAGAPSQAAAMAQYLSEPAIPHGREALAAYYTRPQAASPALAAGVPAAVAAAAQHAPGAALGDALVALAEREVDPAEPGRDVAVPLGLHPRVLEALGIDPAQRLSQQQVANLLQGARADGAALPGQQREISAIDLTFSADKSVSLAWAFAPTEAERAVILQCHLEANEDAVRYATREMGWARSGKAGLGKPDPGHVAWLSFTHYTSRPVAEIVTRDPATGVEATELHAVPRTVADPNLHTHNPVLNLVATDNGRFGSLDTMRFNGRVHEFGAYYQARLATKLRAHGIDVVLDRETGAARIRAIPDRVRDHFSKRANAAKDAARRFAASEGQDWDTLSGEDKVKLVRSASAGSRGAKNDAGFDLEDWRRQAEALRWTHASVVRLGKGHGAVPLPRRAERAYDLSMPFVEDAFHKRGVISGWDMRAAAARGLIETGCESPDDISRVTRLYRDRGVMQDGRLTQILYAEDSARGAVGVTTRLHADQEQRLIDLVRAAAADQSVALTLAEIDRAVRRSGLDFSGRHGAAQRAGLDSLGTGGRFGVVIGVHGSGKSTMLAPFVDAQKRRDRKVYGIALANRQAEALAEAGIDPQNTRALEPFLGLVERGAWKLGESSVVVLDEIGQVGARQMLQLLELRDRLGFTLVAVGDDKQCQAVEAGPVVELLRRALGPDTIPEILTTIRQETERERETALLWREGKAAEALERKREDGTLLVVPGGRDEVIKRVAALYAERLAANAGDDRYSLLVSAPTNADARALSERLREVRRAAGAVGPDLAVVKAMDAQRTPYDLALAKGDRVRLFQRVWGTHHGERVLVGNNGSVLEVVDTSPDGLALRGASGRVAVVEWAKLRPEGSDRILLAHGDAATIDSSQGATATEVIAAMPSGSQAVNGFKGYSGNSRHRRNTWLITSDGAERKEVAARRPLGDGAPVTEADVIGNIARNLSRQPTKTSALAFLDRSRQIREQVLFGFQAQALRAEVRAGRGEAPLPAAQVIRHRRDEQAVAAAAREIERALRERGEALARATGPSAAERAASLKAQRAVEVQEVKAALLNNAQSVVEALLGQPTKRGSQWRYGKSDSTSIRVAVRGPKAGQWFDNESKTGGDLLALIERQKGLDFPKALVWARDFLGMPQPQAGRAMSPADIEKMERHAANLRAALARQEAEYAAAKAARQETVARRAAAVWGRSRPASADHPYLAVKGVQPHGARLDPTGRLRIAMQDHTGKIWSLQHIRLHADGTNSKLFARGGRADGTFAVIGDIEKVGPIAFAEGFATGASVHEATKLPVVVTFSVGNKEKVVAGFREREPERLLIDAADNDHAKERRDPPAPNAGKVMAERLERDHGVVPALPPFRPHEKGSDWNDYARLHGPEAVRQAIREAVQRDAERGGLGHGFVPPPVVRGQERGMER